METIRGGPGERSPADFTARGWKEIATAVRHNITEHRILVLGAGSAFYAVLALSPTLAVGISLFGLSVDSQRVAEVLDQLTGVLDILRDQLQKLVEHSRGRLGATLAFSVTLSLWSANRATKALIDALNIVYGERERRGFVRAQPERLAH